MEKTIKKIIVNIIMMALLFIRTLFLIPHGVCKHTPSCSSYIKEAFLTLPLHKALLSVIIRLLKCNPFSKGGYDPV